MTRAARRSGAPCVDCGTETLSADPDAGNEFYIVHDEVWQAAGMTDFGGCLCIGCLEGRLGRQLHHRDFKRQVPINDLAYHWADYAWWWRSDRLIDRLTRPDPAVDGVQAALWEDS